MINSFWNICSACPMPKEEKLNSEYKRNFVWHPQYRPLAQDVISCAPQSVFKETSIQRRKQYPDLAYRSNEVIRHDLGNSSKNVVDSRARSEERDNSLGSKAGPRSRSAEPGMRHEQHKVMVQSFPPISSGRVSTLPKTEEYPDISEESCETTEYKSQFAWPRKMPGEPPCMARKSVSMNVIKSSDYTVDFSVPKNKLSSVQRPCNKQKETGSLEKTQEAKKKVKTEYKAKYKPFTSYVYVDGEWKKTSSLVKVPENIEEDHIEPWFVEVVERVQRANEYRQRGHGQPVFKETNPETSKPKLDVLVHRSKKVPNDLPLNQPKCHQSSSKKSDNKRKESYIEAVGEKKPPKETKKHALRRPKSAEPAKAKDTVKYKRPATTPPAKLTVHSLPPRNRMPKLEEKVPKAKSLSKKPKDDSSSKPPLPSSSLGKKTQPSPSQSSGGKVWLQAGQSADPTNTQPITTQRSDAAVRPSSLSPISSASPLNQKNSAQANNSTDTADKPKVVEVKPAIPHSTFVPLTHVRTPEEVTGVKSPDPENWTVPIENSERLQWSGVNTADLPSKIKTPEEVSDKTAKAETTAESEPLVARSEESSASSNPGKLTSGNVLDRARSRLDQFWGKNK